MAQQCFIGPGYLRLLNSTGSFKVVNTLTGTTIGSFNGTHYSGNTSSDKVPGEIYIPSGEHCAVYPDNWGGEDCKCPSIPILDFVSDGAGQQEDTLNSLILPDVCVNVDGTPTIAIPVVSVNATTGVVVSTLYINSFGEPLVGDISATDGCDCQDCSGCPEPSAEQGFDVHNFLGQESKYTFDDPTFSNPSTIGSTPTSGWTILDLVNSFNAQASQAIPVNVGSGIDYTSTVFAVSPTDPNFIIVTSGTVPASISLTSIPVDIPLSNI